MDTNTGYFLGHSAKAGARTALPFHLQVTSVYGTLEKSQGAGHLPSPKVLFLATAAGSWALGEEQLAWPQGVLQPPGSCRDQPRVDTAPTACGSEPHTALVCS